jgi:multidrug efflux pump subunit AcrB
VDRIGFSNYRGDYFLRSWKASAVILITIPITLSLTMLVLIRWADVQYYDFGSNCCCDRINSLMMRLLWLNKSRTHEEHPEESSKILVQKAINYLLKAMVGSSLSTIVIFLPFMLMSGVAGAYFKVMTDTMIITLICSFLQLDIIANRLLTLVIRKEKKKSSASRRKRKKMGGIFYQKTIIQLCFYFSVDYCPAIILPNISTGFLPDMDEGSIVLDYNSPPGTSLEETDRELKEVEKIITSTPEVQYSRRTGTQMGFLLLNLTEVII